jgi:GNAT superfamily N-acetyltransferase
VELVDVDRDTETTFLHCLHDERPDDPRVIRLRRRWFDAYRGRGLRAKVLVLDTGEVAGLCQYMPIEHTHIVGEDLLVILCIWVHGYDHHIGNRQGNGYGRYILEWIEADARNCGVAGLAAWGMDFPYWNPVSFYEHMGYSRVDKSGMAVLVWKPFRDGVSPPRFLREARRPAVDSEKASVMTFVNGWCTGTCSQCVTAREAVQGLDDIVDYREVDTSDPEIMRSWGISDGLFVEGEPYRPYEPPWTSEVLRQDLLELANHKRKKGEGME